MKIAVVDDEKTYRDTMISYIEKYAEENGDIIETFSFNSGVDLVSDYKSDCDIMFLDVEMPYMNGIEAAKKIREKDTSVVIIYVTGFSQYAINGYDVAAVDYVMKPMTYAVFCAKMSKAKRFVKRKGCNDILLSPRGGGNYLKISADEIYYLTMEKNYVVYHTASGEYRERGTMAFALKKFDSRDFGSPAAGCLVNLMHVNKIYRDEVYIKDAIFSISRSHKKEFMKSYISYLARGGV